MKIATENSAKTKVKGLPRGRANPQNLKPFQPGQSGNPGGRPKSAAMSQALRAALELPPGEKCQPQTEAEAIAESLIRQAKRGSVKAAVLICDRTEGRPRQQIEISNSFDRESDDEILAKLLERAAQRPIPQDDAGGEETGV
jgi:hypothetical protein